VFHLAASPGIRLKIQHSSYSRGEKRKVCIEKKGSSGSVWWQQIVLFKNDFISYSKANYFIQSRAV
jgi:hypothetical protein